MGLVFVINLKQRLICGVAKHRWNSSLRFHEIGRGSQSYGAKPKREQIMREDREGWKRSRFHLRPCLLGPGLTWLLQMILSPAESENSHHHSMYTAIVLHWDTAYILQLVCTQLQCNTGLGLGCAQLVIQKWRIKSFRVQLCKEHKAMSVAASKRGGPTSLAIHSTLIQTDNPPKFIINQSDLWADRMHSTAPWLF